ncbi:MAG: DUF5696 domain-containing protein, partial [Candidatus Omnitrophica bacterium]|nr:DUF5696 domain-containing protein [Candidatus Omnitrophota bacterium]
HWEKLSTRFVECFNNVSPVFEKVAAKQMLSHRFVTSDHTVQETTFEGGVQVIVNFGESSYQLNDLSYTLPAHGFVVFEDGRVWKEGICS